MNELAKKHLEQALWQADMAEGEANKNDALSDALCRLATMHAQLALACAALNYTDER